MTDNNHYPISVVEYPTPQIADEAYLENVKGHEKKHSELLDKRCNLQGDTSERTKKMRSLSQLTLEEQIEYIQPEFDKLFHELKLSKENFISEMPSIHQKKLNDLENSFEEYIKQLEDDKIYIQEKLTRDLPILEESIVKLQKECVNSEYKTNDIEKNYNYIVEKVNKEYDDIMNRNNKNMENTKLYHNNLYSIQSYDYRRRLCLDYLRKRYNFLKEISDKKQKEVDAYEKVVNEEELKTNKIIEHYEIEKQHRRKLYDELLTYRGHIRVYALPTVLEGDNDVDNGNNSNTNQSNIKYIDDRLIVMLDRSNPSNNVTYEFDYCFNDTNNNNIYEIFDTIKPFCHNVILGYNNTLISYGSSDTMKNLVLEGTKDEIGIIQCAMEYFLKYEKDYPNIKFGFQMSSLEIYGNRIIDLQSLPRGVIYEEVTDWDNQSWNVNPILLNKQQVPIRNMQDFEKFMKTYRIRRSSASTNPEVHEKYSHFIITITMVSENFDTHENYHGSINFVCLAGSELRLQQKISESAPPEMTPQDSAGWEVRAVEDQIKFLLKPRGTFHCDYSLITTLLVNAFNGTSKVLVLLNYLPTIESSNETIKTFKFGVNCHNCYLGNPTRNLTMRKTAASRSSMLAGSSANNNHGTLGVISMGGRSSYSGRPQSEKPQPKLVEVTEIVLKNRKASSDDIPMKTKTIAKKIIKKKNK